MNDPTPVVRKRYYRPKEYAAKAGISLSQVYAEISEKKIPALDHPKRIPREWADRYLDDLDAASIAEVEAEAAIDHSLARRGRVR